VNVIGLKDAPQIGLVRCTGAQPLDRRILVSERLKKSEWELDRLEWLLSQSRDSFFDLNGVSYDPVPST
jgi:hypothetical protein